MTTLQQLMDMRGRRVLLTGATGGIGRVMADTLAELGADLVLIDRPGSDLDSLASELTEKWTISTISPSSTLEGFFCSVS